MARNIMEYAYQYVILMRGAHVGKNTQGVRGYRLTQEMIGIYIFMPLRNGEFLTAASFARAAGLSRQLLGFPLVWPLHTSVLKSPSGSVLVSGRGLR